MIFWFIKNYQQEATCDNTKKGSGENKKVTGTLKGGNRCNSILPPTLYCIEVPYQKQPSEDDGPFVAITWINVLKEVS